MTTTNQGSGRPVQIIVTLPDGSQVGIIGIDMEAGTAHVATRPDHYGVWSPPLPKADTAATATAHVPGTYHVGEW